MPGAMSASHTQPTRRDFIKQTAVTSGAVLLGSAAGGLRTARAARPRVFPELNRRARGWLRFLWEKATTEDDWSSAGTPHEWWDQYTLPGVLSYPRFDLHESSYAILMMADQTPAWREVYSRIVDELAGRYPTYWGAVDWLTQIGDDPQRDEYPEAIMNSFPERLRGKYNRIGWTANGVEPWGLQRDPIGADGNLFFRGWFNLVLGIYKYVSGDDKWQQPFAVTGYKDEQFEWTQRRIVEHLEDQWTRHPEGIHCENTKIWPICLSAAGLGLHLYDALSGKRSHLVYENWLEYCKANYMGVTKNGDLQWFTGYYDPIVDYKANGGPAGGLMAAFYILPQNREFASFLYEAAARQLGWRNPRVPVQVNPLGLILARELGDDVAVARLSAAAERQYEPKFFGKDEDRFGWWFHLNENYPRGQRSALMMVSEVGEGGDWMRAFQTPHLDKFDAPTVEGVDFPSLGLFQAWNDTERGTLHIGTYAATTEHQGRKTSWRITGLPDAGRAVVLCEGQAFGNFEVESPTTIRVDSTVATLRYQIHTGYHGQPAGNRNSEQDQSRLRKPTGANRGGQSSSSPAGSSNSGDSRIVSDLGPVCPCCLS